MRESRLAQMKGSASEVRGRFHVARCVVLELFATLARERLPSATPSATRLSSPGGSSVAFCRKWAVVLATVWVFWWLEVSLGTKASEDVLGSVGALGHCLLQVGFAEGLDWCGDTAVKSFKTICGKGSGNLERGNQREPGHNLRCTRRAANSVVAGRTSHGWDS